jgi:hypothetical protein
MSSYLWKILTMIKSLFAVLPASLLGGFYLVPVAAIETWTTITYDDFETGWGNFVSGGYDSSLKSSSNFPHQGISSARIQDDSGDASSILHASSHDVSGYVDLRVSFWFYAVGLSTNEDFFLEYSSDGGSTWQIVELYVAGANFLNHQFQYSLVTFSSQPGSFDLSNQAKIRIRCDASNNKDKIDIDEIRFEGLEPSTPTTTSPSASPSVNPSSTPSLRPSSLPSNTPSLSPSSFPSSTPSSSPNSPPSVHPSSMPSLRPSMMPSKGPTPLTAAMLCPRTRRYPPEKFSISPYLDTNLTDAVEDDLNEVSSLAFSTQTDSNGNRYAYMASDKEQYSLKVIQFTPNAFDSNLPLHGQGTTVATYTLFTEEPLNDDWEDISLGPCDSDPYSQVCIYIGNIGNNLRAPKPQRKELYIHKFVEPTIGPNGPQDQTVSFTTISFSYGEGFDQSESKYYDAEGMLVDWVGVDGNPEENPGDIYIVTKTGCSGGVGKIPVQEHSTSSSSSSGPYNMTRVVHYPPLQGTIGCGEGPFRAWTGAEMRRDGRMIALIREGPPASVYFYPRIEGQSVAEALSIAPCDYIASTSYGLPNEKKHEAVAFVDPEGLRFADISECEEILCSPTLYQYELEYPDSNFPVVEEPTWGWEIITYDDFESGWGNYEAGGVHAAVKNESDTAGEDSCAGKCACEGDWAVELQEDRGELSSFFHINSYSCSAYALLRVGFKFKLRGYDHMDTLFLEISLDGGANYFIVGDWAQSVTEYPSYTEALDLAICYTGHVLLYPEQFRVSSFGDNVKLRFRNSGNAANDRVYIDEVLFEGHGGSDTSVRGRK